MRTEFLVFGRPDIREDEINEVVATLRSGWIGTGPKVGRFEEEFRDYVGARHAVAVGSCTAALHLSMLVSGVRPGDKVITTPMTFCATVNAIVHTGAQPVFVDVDPRTMNIDVDQLEAAVDEKTRAVVPVHFAGRPCDMEAVLAVARRHDLLVVEDAAHAIESRTSAGKVGSIGDLTCFSFYVTKNVVTAEGGMITTDREEWIDELKKLALHGMSRDAWKRYSDKGFQHYQVEVPGFKDNMTDIQASLGLHQLRRVEENLRRREEIWARYDDAFAGLPLETPAPAADGTVHARHLYTIMVDEAECGIDRDGLQQRLQALHIGTGVHYISVHLQPYYSRLLGHAADDFPGARRISERTLSLPLGSSLSDGDVEDVIEAVQRVLSETSS